MKTAIATTQDPHALARLNDVMTQAGHAANEQAARVAFDDHTARKANNTIRRKIADLALFEQYLNSAGVPASGLYDNPQAWRGITWGIVEASKYGSYITVMLLALSTADYQQLERMPRSPPK